MLAIDLGNVPAWLSAILTSGSLTLGFYVLLRDRRKEERTEASLVVCWRVWSDAEYITHIANVSPRTVVDVTLLVRLPPVDGRFSWEGFPGPAVLRAGEEKTITTPRKVQDGKLVPQFITFQDADGNFWIRDLPTGQLKRLKTTRATRGSAIPQYLRWQRLSGGRQRLRDKIIGWGRSES